MKYTELAYACAKAINQRPKELSGDPKITLKMTEDTRRPEKRFFYGNQGPVGDVVEFGFNGYDTVIFSAIDIMAFLMAMGYLTQITKQEVHQPEIIE